MLRSAQNWKNALFWQFQGHNSGREHENYTNDTIFLIYFLYLLVRFISEFENTWNSFSNSLLWSILVCKIPQFLLKLLICQLIKLFQKVEIPWGYQKSILCFVYLLKENTYFFRIQLMNYMGDGWRKFHTDSSPFVLLFWWQKNSF